MTSNAPQSPFVIDKETYKIMRYLYRQKVVSSQKLIKKFGFDGYTTVAWLCSEHYAAYKEGNSPITYSPPGPNGHDGYFGLTPLGKKYIEDSVESQMKWMIPAMISILSLAISFSTLLLTIFGKNEFWVHLTR